MMNTEKWLSAITRRCFPPCEGADEGAVVGVDGDGDGVGAEAISGQRDDDRAGIVFGLATLVVIELQLLVGGGRTLRLDDADALTDGIVGDLSGEQTELHVQIAPVARLPDALHIERVGFHSLFKAVGIQRIEYAHSAHVHHFGLRSPYPVVIEECAIGGVGACHPLGGKGLCEGEQLGIVGDDLCDLLAGVDAGLHQLGGEQRVVALALLVGIDGTRQQGSADEENENIKIFKH